MPMMSESGTRGTTSTRPIGHYGDNLHGLRPREDLQPRDGPIHQFHANGEFPHGSGGVIQGAFFSQTPTHTIQQQQQAMQDPRTDYASARSKDVCVRPWPSMLEFCTHRTLYEIDTCSGAADVHASLKRVLRAGGEGLMLRHPTQRYIQGAEFEGRYRGFYRTCPKLDSNERHAPREVFARLSRLQMVYTNASRP